MASQIMSDKLPNLVTDLPGPKARDIIASDHRYISPSYTRSYPLVVRSAKGAIVEDVDGNRFLDFSAGIAACSTGHCHPDVVRAIQKQAESLIPECDACGIACANYLEEVVFKTTVNPSEVAAIVVETIQGEGGYIVPPPDFFPTLEKIARKHGILLIADEVQCGMGRTGKMFAFEHFDFHPDIVALAKGIASGMPLGVTMARAEIMTWEPGAHASTFGGNPVCLAAALETVRLLEEKYVANSAKLGEYLRTKLEHLKERQPAIIDVRGRGLMIGIELASGELRDAILNECFRRGLLILGASRSTIRLSPPLVIDEEQADFAVDTISEAIAERT